jgi:hypothetical protein
MKRWRIAALAAALGLACLSVESTPAHAQAARGKVLNVWDRGTKFTTNLAEVHIFFTRAHRFTLMFSGQPQGTTVMCELNSPSLAELSLIQDRVNSANTTSVNCMTTTRTGAKTPQVGMDLTNPVDGDYFEIAGTP